MIAELGRVAPTTGARGCLAVDLVLVGAGWYVLHLAGAPAWALPLAWAVWVAAAAALRHYDPAAQRTAAEDLAETAAIAVAAGVPLLAAGSLQGAGLAHGGGFLFATLPVVLAARPPLRRLLGEDAGPPRLVLIVGAGPLARQLAARLEAARPRTEVVGCFGYHDEPAPLDPVPDYLGPAAKLEGWLLTQPVAEVFLAGDPARHAKEMQAAVDACELLGVPFALPEHRFRMARARRADARPGADGFLHFLPVEARPAGMALKRLFDIAASAAALVVLAPLLLLVAALIKLTSRGPVLFQQVRVGLGGRPFHMLKFRSMVVDAEAKKASLAAKNEQRGPVFKIRNDPRITPLGRIIRKYSIDELPQLVNVLRGEMSVVGPRPPVPSEVSRYEPWQRRRLSVRPGLTCIWQVSGRNQITFDEWMYMDMRYIDHWSLGGDLALVLKTLPVVVTGKGAS